MGAAGVVDRAELEQRLARCPLLYPSLGRAFVGRDEDLERLRAHLQRGRLAILRADRDGMGSTRLALEYGHRTSAEYPGGVLWIPSRSSYRKELAADVIEALGLPQSCSQRYPFVSTDGAFETMWRGLRDRERTLIILDGWEEWDEAKPWRDDNANVHVVVIAPSRVAVADEYRFVVGPLALASVAEHLGRSSDDALLRALSDDALSLSLAMSGTNAVRADDLISRTIDSLSANGRRALALLTLFNAEPIPRGLLANVAQRISAVDGSVDCAAGVEELARRRVCQISVFDEPYAHVRVLSQARDLFAQESHPWRGFVLDALVEEAEAQTWETPHSARRVEQHVRRALFSDFDACAPADVFARLARAAAKGSRHRVAAQASAKAVDAARTSGADAALLDALKLQGRALSETRELPAAQAALREAVTVAERLHGTEAVEVADVLDLLDRAIGLGVCGSCTDEELAIAKRSLALRERAWGHDDTRLAGGFWHVGLKHAVRGELEDALSAQERGLALSRAAKTAIDDHLQSYAVTLAEVGRFDEAFAALEEALEARRANGGRWLTPVLLAAREVAEKALRPDWLLQRIDAALSWPNLEDDPDEKAEVSRARLIGLRAAALAKLGRHEEAAKAAREALPLLTPLYGDHARIVELRQIAESAI